MRPQPELRPTSMHALRVPRHVRCRSSSGPSLQKQKQTKVVNDLILGDRIFDCSAITGCHWRWWHLDAIGFTSSSGSIEVAGDSATRRSNDRPSGKVGLVGHLRPETQQKRYVSNWNPVLRLQPDLLKPAMPVNCPCLWRAHHWAFLTRGVTHLPPKRLAAQQKR